MIEKNITYHDARGVEFPEDFYRSLIENTRNIVWVISRDEQQVVFINRDFSGLKRDKILEEGLSLIWPLMTIDSLESILYAIERAATGESTENLRTEHKNVLTGREEYYLNSIFPLSDSTGRITHIQISSREITSLVTARRTIDILNSVSDAVQNNMFSGNLFKLVGERLKKYDIHIIIFLSSDRKITRLVYTNFPVRKLKKALSIVGRDDVLTGTPIDDWLGLKRTIMHKKAEYFGDPYAYFKSRTRGVIPKSVVGDIVNLLGLSKVIVAPMIENRVSVGAFIMFSPIFTETDLSAVKTFAVQFTNALLNSQLYSDTERLKSYLGTLLEHTGEAVITADGAGRIVAWNRAASEILGFEEHDIIGGSVRKIGLDTGIWGEMLEASRKGITKRYERTSLRALDGSKKQLTIITSPVEKGDAKDPGVIMLLKDRRSF